MPYANPLGAVPIANDWMSAATTATSKDVAAATVVKPPSAITPLVLVVGAVLAYLILGRK
jgi:hypothetical protein